MFIKYLIVVFMLVCSVAWGCDYCLDNPGEKEIQTNGMGANSGTEQLQKDHLILVRRINAVDKKVKHKEDTLDKIYSMVCDLETKFMGNDRMEQITNPDHIPETIRAKKHFDKMAVERMKKIQEEEVNWIGHPVISDNDSYTPSQGWLPNIKIGLRKDGIVVWKKITEKE